MSQIPRIIKTLNNTPRFFYWDLDVFLLGLIPFFAGMWMSSKFLMIAAIPAASLFSMMKKKYPPGGLMHLLYWNIPTDTLNKLGVKGTLSPSHKRKFFL